MSKLLWAMFSFISRLPIPVCQLQGLDFEHYSRGIVMFFLVDVVLGGLTGLALMTFQPWCGAPLAALFTVSTLALLTGEFHLDGLVDTCDGIFSARRRRQILEIIRDSRLDTHGGLALTFVPLVKVLVVSELVLHDMPMLVALAATRTTGRGMAVLPMYWHRYACEEGLGNVFTGKVTGRQACVTLGLTAVLAAMLLPGMCGVAALVVTTVAIFTLEQLSKRTLGGQTGDTLGVAIESGELIFLLALF